MQRLTTPHLRLILLLLATTFLNPSASAHAAPGNYQKVIEDTIRMTADREASRLAASRDLEIVNVTWEDTGRYKDSAVGANISDMTIQVQYQDPYSAEQRLYLMPVIRYDNFVDKTADLPIEDFFLLVGNEKGAGALEKVSLDTFLDNLRDYLTLPDSWRGETSSLLADRDSHVLVSAQAAFLPIPGEGIAEFNPVLFNYQSMPGEPAVLTILATREGTSVTVIDNTRDAFSAGGSWGQRLFFNQAGQRASLTGTRLSDFQKSTDVETSAQAGSASGLGMVLMIQVPLKHRPLFRKLSAFAYVGESAASVRGEPSDVEAAVIGHGKVEGPFTEIDDLAIKRDPDYPIRVTVQFYKATSNGVVSPEDIDDIATQIERVYADADFIGSLVTEGEGARPTEHAGPKEEPPGWWQAFWDRLRGER